MWISTKKFERENIEEGRINTNYVIVVKSLVIELESDYIIVVYTNTSFNLRYYAINNKGQLSLTNSI
jgi:hypothetical protein